MRFAYADPPYPGQAEKHYSHDDRCAEVNHGVLIGSLCESYDSWALSTSSTALRDVLALCPSDVRVMAWVKPFAAWKRNVNPSYAWEPVIVWRPRPRPADGPRYMNGYRDWVRSGGVPDLVEASITLRKGLVGVKPRTFCFWLFEVLNLQPGDEFEDVFPGSGAVSHAYDEWTRQAPWAHDTDGQGSLFAAAGDPQ
jgi:hypothetical protein